MAAISLLTGGRTALRPHPLPDLPGAPGHMLRHRGRQERRCVAPGTCGRDTAGRGGGERGRGGRGIAAGPARPQASDRSLSQCRCICSLYLFATDSSKLHLRVREFLAFPAFCGASAPRPQLFALHVNLSWPRRRRLPKKTPISPKTETWA